MSIKMRVAVLFVVSYFSGSKMGGSDNDIIFVSALGKIQVRRKSFQFGWDLELKCIFSDVKTFGRFSRFAEDARYPSISN